MGKARCSYEGCKSPTKSREFIQIDEHTKAGGRDWRELAGSVLCNACHKQFSKRGTLERTVLKPLAASARRCSYEGCNRPTNSTKFYQIDEHKKAGGQDWRELAGSVLCNACYRQFKDRGTLERTVHRHDSLAASARRCSYEGCKSPTKGRQFTMIDEHTNAGGQDWRELAGSVLCIACYNQFKRSGTLERTQHQHSPLAASARRCSHEGCKSPTKSSRFTQIDGDSEAGGQNWRELAGSVLCEACYRQFSKRGTLERTVHKHEPLAASARRCSYEGCKSPTEGKWFYQIDEHTRAGGQDWRELAGSVLCHSCYTQFRKRGTLERTVHNHVPVAVSARRCSYEGCKSPTKSSRFHQIDEHTKAGGQDWRELAGSVLCGACYYQFTNRGTLERTVHRHESLAASARRCSYEGCRNPTKGSQFTQIHGGKKAGGRDWGELAGSVLCDACYNQFKRSGTLERAVPRHAPLAGSARRCSYEGCKSPTKSSQFILIDEHSKAGGRDWSELEGSVLCTACFYQFKKRGTLERTQHQHAPLAASARRCSYEGCKSPTKSREFIQIDEHTKAGGQDWRELAGSVLCDACYSQFSKRGNLERTVHKHEPLAASARRCSYEGCKSPTKSSQFILIDEHTKAGGRDWRELAGSVLCHSCYNQFKRSGTLERTVDMHEPLVASARRCSYEGCQNPTKSREFILIDEHTKAGGQDWRELAGSVLCNACYTQFTNRGTLERTQHRAVPVSQEVKKQTPQGHDELQLDHADKRQDAVEAMTPAGITSERVGGKRPAEAGPGVERGGRVKRKPNVVTSSAALASVALLQHKQSDAIATRH